jgi:hypothetical protein
MTQTLYRRDSTLASGDTSTPLPMRANGCQAFPGIPPSCISFSLLHQCISKHSAVQRRFRGRKSGWKQLHHEGEAICGVNDALHDPNYCHSGDLIQSISFLAMNETEEKEEPPDPSPFVDPSVVECPMARSLREQKLRHVARKCRAGDDQTKRRHAQPQDCWTAVADLGVSTNPPSPISFPAGLSLSWQ